MTSGNYLRHFRNVVVAAFLTSLMAGTFLPVYTDEIGWRFQERAALDGVDKMFSDQCGANTLTSPPFFMMPVRYFSAFFNTMFADPIFVRLSGVAYALVFAFLLLRLLDRIAVERCTRWTLGTIAFALMSLGVMPLLLVWSRPEQPILLSVTSALAVAWSDGGDPQEDTAETTAWLRSVGVLLLAAVAVSYHLKGLALIPAFLVCIFFASQGRKSNLPRLVSGLVLVALAILAAQYWLQRFQCPGDPILAARYSRHNVGVAAFRDGGWASALHTIFGNLDLFDYFLRQSPEKEPMSQWLPPNLVTLREEVDWSLSICAIWLVATAAFVASLALGALKGLRDHHFDRKLAMAVLLFGAAVVWSATQTIKNVYDATFVLPMVALAFVFSFSVLSSKIQLNRFISRFAVVLGGVAIVSQLLVAKIYLPTLWRMFQENGYLPRQPNSVAVRGFSELMPDILGAAAKCGISEERRPKGLLIDELTYFAFMKSYRPQHRLGVFSDWKGSITDPVAYLRNIDSDGVIVGCQYLSADLRQRAQSQGAFCCLGPPNW